MSQTQKAPARVAPRPATRFMVNHECVGLRYKGEPISQAELGLSNAEWQRLVDLKAVVLVEDVPAAPMATEPIGEKTADKTGE